MKTNNLALALCLLPILYSCAPPAASQELDESCNETKCSEQDLNAPVDGKPAPKSPAKPTPPPPIQGQRFQFPAFQSNWGLKKELYDKMERYYDTNSRDFANTRYAVIIDFSQHSSQRRFYLFDLETQKVERYLTSHGLNSDQNNDGFADSFSNIEGSKQSSLGFYRTLGTYSGKHGYSMRLEGLSSSNSNAFARAIVVHPADYVNEETPRSGRSWGCPALDPDVSKAIIDKIKNGSVLLIDF
jgi:hypothetical protein